MDIESLLAQIMSMLNELGNLLKSLQNLQCKLQSESAQSHIRNMMEMHSNIIEEYVRECDTKLSGLERDHLNEHLAEKYDVITLKLMILRTHFTLPSPKSAQTFVEIFNKDGMFNSIEYLSLNEIKILASAMRLDFSNRAYMRQFSEYIGRYTNYMLISYLQSDELGIFNAWLLSSNNKHILETFINRNDLTKELLIKTFQHALFKFDLDIADTSESGIQDHYEESGLKTLFDSGKIATTSMWIGPVNTQDIRSSWKYHALNKLLEKHDSIPRKFLIGLISKLSPKNDNKLLLCSLPCIMNTQRRHIVMDALIDNGHALALIFELLNNRDNQYRFTTYRDNQSLYYLFSDNGITDRFNGPIQATGDVASDIPTEYPSLLHALVNKSLIHILHSNSYNNVASMLQIMKSHGANLNIVDADGRTALMALIAGVTETDKTEDIFNLSLQLGHRPIQFSPMDKVLFMTNQLILNSTDLSIVDINGDTALTLACRNLLSDYVECKIIKALILSGSNMNHADNEGNTPLHLLARRLTRIREQFIDNISSDVAQSDAEEVDFQSLIVMTQDDFITPNIRLLLALGANNNIENSDGDTPLMVVERGLHTVPDGIRAELMQVYTKIFDPSQNEPVYMLGIECYKTNAYVNELGNTFLLDDNHNRYMNRFILELVQNPENIEELSTCPITLNIFKEPIIAPSGHSYEASAIKKWVNSHHTDPQTKQALSMDQLRLNKIARKIIFTYSEYGSELRSKYWSSATRVAQISSLGDQNLLQNIFNSQTTESKLHHLACIFGITAEEFSAKDENIIHKVFDAEDHWYESVTYKTGVKGSYDHINTLISKFYHSSVAVLVLACALKENFPNTSLRTIIDRDNDIFENHYSEVMTLLLIYFDKMRCPDIEKAKILMSNLINHNQEQFFKNVMDAIFHAKPDPQHFYKLFVVEIDRFSNSFVDIAIDMGALAYLDGTPRKGIVSLYLNIMEELVRMKSPLFVPGFKDIYDSKVIEQMSRVGNVSDTDSEGRTLLSQLCIFNPGIAEFEKQLTDDLPILLKHGLDINQQDNSGMTALHSIFNSEFYHSDPTLRCVELLIASGADPRIKDSSGKLPVDYAESSNIQQTLAQKSDSLNSDGGHNSPTSVPL